MGVEEETVFVLALTRSHQYHEQAGWRRGDILTLLFFFKWHNQWLVLIRMMVIYNVDIISYNTLSPQCEDEG